jgi:pimeloyl-ACP methyl ester carboxylesterase
VSDVVVASGWSTVALQQRGYDADARPQHVSAYRLPELAADVEALVDHLGATRCHLVGHDWGGIVAWYLAATRPQRCASLTVLSTPHPRAYAASMGCSAQALRSTYAVAFQLPLLPELALTAQRGALLRTSLIASGLDAATARRYAGGLADRRAMRAALHWYRAAFRHPGDARAVGRFTVPTSGPPRPQPVADPSDGSPSQHGMTAHTCLPTAVGSHPQLVASWSTIRSPKPPSAFPSARMIGGVLDVSWTARRTSSSWWSTTIEDAPEPYRTALVTSSEKTSAMSPAPPQLHRCSAASSSCRVLVTSVALVAHSSSSIRP